LLEIRRREFIAGLGGTAAWPLAARAQERVRRVAFLSVGIIGQVPFLRNELAKLGWVEGRNLQLDFRYGAGNSDRIRDFAAELVNLRPDVIVALGVAPIWAAQERTQTIPVVFIGGGDVYATGLVKNLARPDGNITGIANLFASIGGKWLEILKDAVPSLERVAYVYNPDIGTQGQGSYFAAIAAAAPVLAVNATEMPFRNAVDLVHAIDAFAAMPNGGLIVSPAVLAYSEVILTSAAQHRLPTAGSGGYLIGYGALSDELYRRGASFVDRILRGAKVADLPVEYPTRFRLAVNLKMAKAIGLAIPESFLRAPTR
jgi:putative ABC transport system substrate-binding protein